MKLFLRLLHHDLRLQIRHPVEWASLILFFTIVILLLPFAIGPEPELLRRLAPGLIWLAALLMSLLSLERLFIQDARDGTLDLMLLSPLPLSIVIFSKLLVQSCVMLAALLVMLAPAMILLGLDAAVLPILAATLALGVPIFVLLGGIMGAITVALERNPAMLSVLLVPFYIPVLIFATGACDAAALGAPVAPNLLLLGAMLAFLLPASPFIIAAALRQGS
jgi:heme exporter protein B